MNWAQFEILSLTCALLVLWSLTQEAAGWQVRPFTEMTNILSLNSVNSVKTQECIPVGCILPAH